ncbi:hypothetical protein J4857_07480 [Prevotella jejuni]|nr:hypothetical protein J4857_07480 [Prevotella jejuni]
MKKQKQKKPDGRCATCPRWDRWHIRILNPEDQQKLIRFYRKSGEVPKRSHKFFFLCFGLQIWQRQRFLSLPLYLII